MFVDGDKMPLTDLDQQVDLTTEIIQLHDHLTQYPADIKTKGKLDRKLSKWLEMLEITVFVANNEQLPYTSSEIGYPTRPMLLKSQSNYQQVGDYQTFVDGYGGYYLPFVVDRKTMGDLYGTLLKKSNRDRFYRELERFYQDDRFKRFYIFAECGLIDFLNYQPPNAKEKGNLRINQKLAVIASLESRNCHVMFCGNRKLSIRLYRDFIRQFVLKNYETILNLK